MSKKISVIYWCQGAGHAARNIAIANELESRGADVTLDGGGPGQRFAEMNGFGNSGYEFETIPVLSSSPLSIIYGGLTKVIPSGLKRLRTVFKYLRDEDPDIVVTDCHVTIFASTVLGKELYTVNHLRPDFFSGFSKLAAKFFDWFSLLRGEKIFFTCLWKEEGPEGDVEYIDPLAQEGEGSVEPYDVLLIPGSFGKNFERLREKLEDEGLDVRAVGDDSWETKKSMTPYTEAANCVVCTGFSSIADSVVAGTPCVVYPHLTMQELLARQVDERDVKGVETAYSLDEAFDTTVEVCEGDTEKPNFGNGAEEVADYLLQED